MEAYYSNEHIYVGDDEISSRRDDEHPQRQRSNFKKVSNTTSTQNSGAAITKMDGKLRIVFSVMVVFFIVTLAVFCVLAHWISRLNIQNIEQRDQQSTNLKLIEELKNQTRAAEEQNYQQSTISKLTEELKNETSVTEAKLINMMNEIMETIQRSTGLCYVGLSTGIISTSQISASTVHGSCPLWQAPLNAVKAWCAEKNTKNEWIQVDYLAPRKITGILTRGRGDFEGYVTSYRVSYGNATSEMQEYMELEKVKIFSANTDQNTIVDNGLSPPINARYVRIHPETFEYHMSMRMEMRDC